VTIYFAPKAEEDFAAIIRYLAERNPTAAMELGDRIFTIIDKLTRDEFEGPEQRLVSATRRAVHDMPRRTGCAQHGSPRNRTGSAHAVRAAGRNRRRATQPPRVAADNADMNGGLLNF